jgi:hypothetical protein
MKHETVSSGGGHVWKAGPLFRFNIGKKCLVRILSIFSILAALKLGDACLHVSHNLLTPCKQSQCLAHDFRGIMI